jgi:hypothetical protein
MLNRRKTVLPVILGALLIPVSTSFSCTNPHDDPSSNVGRTASKPLPSKPILGSAAFIIDTVLPATLFVGYSFSAALAVLAWEDVACTYVLPSRQLQTTLLSDKETASKINFGRAAIRGMGFGRDERLLLLEDDSSETRNIRGYNEVMLEHRQERVPRWRRTSGDVTTKSAIHILCECVRAVQRMQALANDYQWSSIRQTLQTKPMNQLELAASQLRRSDPDAVIGFDWGSCAWRHCGALADAQEALDELDHLLGILDPKEAVFCLDVVERSLRDILRTVTWTEANDEDVRFWKELPAYQALTVHTAGDDEDGVYDQDYLAALQDLRLD